MGSGGEPYIDMIDRDGIAGNNPQYDGPIDQLWQGLTNEPIAFDYTNGQGERLHPSQAVGGIPAAATVRNLSSEARQLYARQLYILMMLLVDDNYVQTPDIPYFGGKNINNQWLFEAVAAANHPGVSNLLPQTPMAKTRCGGSRLARSPNGRSTASTSAMPTRS